MTNDFLDPLNQNRFHNFVKHFISPQKKLLSFQLESILQIWKLAKGTHFSSFICLNNLKCAIAGVHPKKYDKGHTYV